MSSDSQHDPIPQAQHDDRQVDVEEDSLEDGVLDDAVPASGVETRTSGTQADGDGDNEAPVMFDSGNGTDSATQPSLSLTATANPASSPGLRRVFIPADLSAPDSPDGETVFVQIVYSQPNSRPFLGGFRHKLTGSIRLHSSTQTARPKRQNEQLQRFHRETQTSSWVTRSQQTQREVGTQMAKKDLYQSGETDRIIEAREYIPADEIERRRDVSAKEIQCFLRQCFAYRRVRRLMEEKMEALESLEHAQREAERREQEEHERQIQRRMNPRSKEDFAILYKELESWRAHETRRIKESYGSIRKEWEILCYEKGEMSVDELNQRCQQARERMENELRELLEKEVKLLQTMDRLKSNALKENRLQSIREQLEKMASPKEWMSREGDRVEVETPFTERAKLLVDLYNALQLNITTSTNTNMKSDSGMGHITRDERIEILHHIKVVIQEFDSVKTRELYQLIEREEDLLRRQRSDASLEGLRKRISQLYLAFIQTPEYNPEAANFKPAFVMAKEAPAVVQASVRPASATKAVKVGSTSNYQLPKGVPMDLEKRRF